MSEDTDPGQANSLTWTLLSIAISSGVFGAMAYYVGRRYLEGYYQTLGVPSSLIHFDFAEAIYASARSGIIIAVVFFALMIYRLVRLLAYSDSGNADIFKRRRKFKREPGIPPIKSNRHQKVFLIFRISFWIVTIIYVGSLVWLAFILTLPPSTYRNLIQVEAVVVSVMYGYLLTEDGAMNYLFGWRGVRRIFAVAFALSLVVVLYLALPLPFAYGQSKGLSDWTNNPETHVLPRVTIYTNKQLNLPGVTWISQDGGTFKSEKPLVLLYEGDQASFAKMESPVNGDSPVLVLENGDIMAIQVVDPR